MNVFDLHPREVHTHLFAEAYALHNAASATYKLANRIPPKDEALAITAQRKVILTIDAQLLTIERNRILDSFCAAWLRYRDIPIPTHDDSTSSVDLQRPAEFTTGVQTPIRPDESSTITDGHEDATSTTHRGEE